MSEVSSISRSGSADHVDAVSTRIPRPHWSLRQLLTALVAGLPLILVGLHGDYWWNTGRFLVTTDDAYVQEVHSALIAPQVSGYIIAVPVDDNERVHAGQLLAKIDPRLYQAALDQARANVVAAQASIATLEQQIKQQRLVVDQDRQQVTSD